MRPSGRGSECAYIGAIGARPRGGAALVIPLDAPAAADWQLTFRRLIQYLYEFILELRALAYARVELERVLANKPKIAYPKTQRLHQVLARKLGISIVSGKIKPGQTLDGEIEAAAANDVSRTAYREAIRILTAKGLLESRPKAGTRVTERSRWNLMDPEILAWMFSGRPDEAFVRDLFELRSLIEPAAAAFAAERRTQDQIALMHAAIEGMRKYGLASPAGRAADQDFHRVILEAAGNEALASLSSSVGAAVTWTTYFKQRHLTSPRNALPDHEHVLAAIEAGSAKRARQAMHDLVSAALHDMGLEPARRVRPPRAD